MKSLFAYGLVVALMSAATMASSATIFADSFEEQVNSRNWQVYADSFGDWTSTIGTGIEVQRSGVVVRAQDGDQYIELDSDRNRGGDRSASTTNSSMTRMVNLAPGTYRLTWYYQPRTNTPGDNLIEVYLGGAAQSSLLSKMIGYADGAGQTGWEFQKNSFVVGEGEDFRTLTFLAGGRANSYGGLMDNVTLSQIPLPAGISLLLAGLAAFGVVRLRRRL